MGQGAWVVHNCGGKPFSVDPNLKSTDKLKGVLKDDSYLLNPTAHNLTNVSPEVTLGGRVKIDGNLLNGKYMYVVDLNNNLIIGTRAKQFIDNDTGFPHPSLIGGKNPEVYAAGIVEFRGGTLIKVDNASGHFKPNHQSLDIAETAFRKHLPEHVFTTGKFEGFIPYDR